MRTRPAFFICFCLFLFTVSFPAPGMAVAPPSPGRAEVKIAGSTITADNLTYSNGKYYFHGSVHVLRNDMHGGADDGVYDEAAGDLYLSGNVWLVDPDVVVNAAKARLNVKSKTGTLYNASIFLRASNLYVKSPKINKTGPGVYVFEKVVVTACDSPKPAWALTGGKTEVLVGSNVKIKNAILKLGPVPVLYAPWFASPAGTQRASGFLAPNMGFTSFGGAYLEVPYYWAISNNNWDATFNFQYYSKRALGASVEQRYLEHGGFSGTNSLTFLRDWSDSVDYLYLRGRDIGPNGFLTLDLANHQDFNKQYDFNFQERERRFLESKAEAYLDFPDAGKAFLRTRWFQDELDGVDQSSVLQELPEAGFYSYPRRVGPYLLGHPLIFNAEGAAANFWREDGQSALRAIASPRLSYATGDQVTLFQSAGLGFRHYDFYSPSQDIDRAVFDYDAAIRSRLLKTYGNGVTHYIEPSLEFIYRNLSGPASPMVFDSVELEDKTELVQAALLNRLLDAGGEFLDMSLTGGYDAQGGMAEPLTLNVALSRPAVIGAQVLYDPRKAEFTSAQINTSFHVLKQATLMVNETYTQATESWVHNIDSLVVLSPSITLIDGGWYDSKAGLQEVHSELRFSAQCWGMDLVFSKKPGDTSFFVRLRLLGIGRSA